MATISGSVTSNGSYYTFYLTTSISQNIANNTSTVTAKMYIDTNNTSYDFTANADMWLEIDGNKKSLAVKVDTDDKWPNGHPVKLMEHVRTITHAANGSHAKINVSGYFRADGGGWGPGKCYAGLATKDVAGVRLANTTLATIPRASYFTSTASFSVGGNIAVKLYRYSTSFTHKLSAQYKKPIGTWSEFTSASDIGTSTTLSVGTDDIANMYDLYSDGSTVPIRIVCKTMKNGTTQVGSDVTITGSVTLPLLTDAVWASGTPSNIRIGDAASLDIYRSNASFTHTVTFTVGTYTGTAMSKETGSSCTINTAAHVTNILTAMPGSGATMVIRIKTFYGTYELGSYTLTRNVNCLNRVPTFSGSNWTYSCDYSSLTGNNQYLILNVGTLTCNISAANKAVAATGATITKYEISDGGKSSIMTQQPDGSFQGYLSGPSNGRIKLTAIDSRNLRTDTYKDVPVDSYTLPYFTETTAHRVGQVGTYTALTLAGSFWSGKFGPDATGTANTVTFDLAYKYATAPDTSYATVYTNKALVIGTNSLSFEGLINGNLGSTGYTNDAFTLRVTIKDKLRTVTRDILLVRGNPTLHLTKYGVGIGKTYENGALDVGGDVHVSGSTYVIGAAYHTDAINISRNVNTPSLVLKGTSAGWASGLQLENTTSTYGKKYGIMSNNAGEFSISDETDGTKRLKIDSSGKYTFFIKNASNNILMEPSSGSYGEGTLIPSIDNYGFLGTESNRWYNGYINYIIAKRLTIEETISLPTSMYNASGGGLNANNSDIIGLNGLYFGDACGTNEGVFFPKTGKDGSTNRADYDVFRMLDGKGYLNNKPIYSETELWNGSPVSAGIMYDSVSNYEYVEIFYVAGTDKAGGYGCGSTKVYQASGARASISLWTVSNDMVYCNNANIRFSGTSFNMDNAYANRTRFAAPSGVNITMTKALSIYRIIGYK